MDVGPLTGQMVDLLVEEADREVVGLGGDVLGRPMKAGPQSAGSSIVSLRGAATTPPARAS